MIIINDPSLIKSLSETAYKVSMDFAARNDTNALVA